MIRINKESLKERVYDPIPLPRRSTEASSSVISHIVGSKNISARLPMAIGGR